MPRPTSEDPRAPSGRRVQTRPMTAAEADSSKAATNAVSKHGADRVRLRRLVLSTQQLARAPLSSRDGFVLSFVDGVVPVATVIDASGMPQEEVLEIIDRLAALNIVRVG